MIRPNRDNGNVVFTPSPEEIAREAAKIRDKWSARELYKRATGFHYSDRPRVETQLVKPVGTEIAIRIFIGRPFHKWTSSPQAANQT